MRVDIARLRQRLAEYYADAPHDVRISIPKGTYIPSFAFPEGRPSPTLTRREMLWAAGAGAVMAGAGVAVFRRTTGSYPVFAQAAQNSGPDVQAFLRRLGEPAAPSGGRPFVHLVGGCSQEGSGRYISALIYTDLYEFPTFARLFEFRSSAEMNNRLREIARTLEAGTGEAHRAARQLGSKARQRAAEICREIWRQRSGGPDYLMVREDPPLPVSELLRRVGTLQRALEIDPAFGCTHSELAWAYRLAAEHDSALYDKARTHAEQAVSLSPELGTAQFVLGYIRFFSDWRFEDAADRLRQALYSQPLREAWYRYFVNAALITGRYDDAAAALDCGRALNAGTTPLLLMQARVDQYRRDYGRMEARARALLGVSPGLFAAHLLLARALLYQGKLTEAEAAIRAAASPDHPSAVAVTARLRALAGDSAGAERLLRHPAVVRFPSIGLQVLALLGQRERAEERLRAAVLAKDPNLPFALAEPEPRLDGEAWLTEAAASLQLRRA